MKQGNRCLYYSKQLFNSLLILAGAILIAIGAYIWTETKAFSIIEMTFIGLGLIQMLLGFFGIMNCQLVMSSKKASLRIKCYNYLLGILFVGSVIGLILGFTLKDQLIEKAAEQQSTSTQSIAELEELINKNVSIALYVTISCLAIQLLALLFSIWYSDSLETLNENFEMIYDEKLKYILCKIQGNTSPSRNISNNRKQQFKQRMKREGMMYTKGTQNFVNGSKSNNRNHELLNFYMSNQLEAPLNDEEDNLDIRKAAHPLICLYHIIFKLGAFFWQSLCVFSYFVMGLFMDGLIKYLLILVLDGIDFYVVKFISGRYLVGLRWYSDFNKNGKEVMKFEQFDDEERSKVDQSIFWTMQYGASFLWAFLVFANIMSLGLIDIVLAFIGASLSWINLVGYYKSSKNERKKMNKAKRMIAMKGMRMMMR